MIMSEFVYKTYRCEWQVISQPVGQYMESRGEPTVLSVWPDRESAVADRPNWAVESKYIKDRWLPKFDDDGYTLIGIDYRQVLVEEITK